MFKYIFILLIVFSGLGASLNHMASASLRSVISLQNVTIAQNAYQMLRSRIVYQDGVYYAPAGEISGGVYTLPSGLSGARTTGTGSPFLYCPFSSFAIEPSDSTVTIEDIDGLQVRATIGSIPLHEGNFILRSDAAPIAGLVAAFIEKRSGTPSCQDIALDEHGKWFLSGQSELTGRVFAIHKEQLNADSNAEWVHTANSESSISVDDVFAKASGSNKSQIVITLNSSIMTLSQDHSFMSQGLRKRITIRSKDGSHAVISGDSSLLFRNVDVELENVSFEPGVSILAYDSKVDLTDVSLSSMLADGVQLTSSDVQFQHPSQTPLSLTKSTWTMSDGVSLSSSSAQHLSLYHSVVRSSQSNISISGVASTFISMVNSQWFSGADQINLLNMPASSFGFVLRNGSSLSLDQSTVDITGNPDASFFIEGDLRLTNTMIESNGVSGLYLASTGTLSSSNSQVGVNDQFPSFALWHDGGIARGDISLRGGSCISGDGTQQTLQIDINDNTVNSVNPDGSVNAIVLASTASVDLYQKLNPIVVTCL